MKTRKSLLIFSFTLGMFAFTSCQDNNRQNEAERVDMENNNAEMTEQNRMEQERLDRQNNSVSARLEDNQELSTFSQGMTRAELDDDFREGEGPYTIFAPSNVAYDELSQEQREQFNNIQNRERTGAVMHYLAIEDEVTADELRREIENANGNYTLNTMQGEQLTASLDGEDIVLRDASGNTARITETDLDASNGVVHVIDRVLKPGDDTKNQAENKDWNTRNDQMNYERGDDRNMNNNNTDATGTNNTTNDRNTGNNTGNTNNSGNTTDY